MRVIYHLGGYNEGYSPPRKLERTIIHPGRLERPLYTQGGYKGGYTHPREAIRELYPTLGYVGRYPTPVYASPTPVCR